MQFFAKIFFEVLLNKLIELGLFLYNKVKRKEEIKKETNESVQPLKDAKTKEEIDAATDRALDGF